MHPSPVQDSSAPSNSSAPAVRPAAHGRLYRLGRACAARPWRVVLAWLLVVVAVTAVSMVAGGTFRDAMTVPGTGSDRAMQRLRADFPANAGAEAHLVVKTAGGQVDPVVLDQVVQDCRAVAGVRTVTSRRAADGRFVVIGIGFAAELPDLDARRVVDELTAASRPLEVAGAEVAVGGQVPESIQVPGGAAEAVGVAVALIVLLVAFGSFLCAGLPLLTAAAGLGVGLGLIGLLAAVTEVNSVSPTLGSMLGLGVGIDYGLFVIARHRQGLAARLSPVEAAAHATATAGRSVLYAGLSVLIGITGLAFSGSTGFASMGIASALVVLACVVAALTLLPALLAALGPRVFGRRARRRAKATGILPEDSFHSVRAERLARRVTRHPGRYLVAAVVVLLALAAPALSMRLGQNDAGSESVTKPTRKAFDLVAEGFGPGWNGPVLVVIDPVSVGPAELESLRARIVAMPGVQEVSAPSWSAGRTTVTVQIVPTTAPASPETADLAKRLRSTLPAGADLTGPTAATLDLTEVLAGHLWQVILAVLTATFVLLMLVFRSLLLPAKAVLANLLSVGASYGVMTLLFQTTPGARLIGLDGIVPIAGWAPMVLFAILFGLSMDYEVFVLSSVREHRDRGLTNRESVIRGLGASAKVVSYAAAIMVSVAAGFALDSSVMVKIIGVGMAAAILIDVTVVRLVLVPAAMAFFGAANWYFPGRGAANSRPVGSAGRSLSAPGGAARSPGGSPRRPRR